MSVRLASDLFVAALLRRVSVQGGNGVVVARGDPKSGTLILLLAERGQTLGFRERLLSPDGRYTWRPTGPTPESTSDIVTEWLSRRRARDPDLWVIELDIPNVERFAAEMSSDD